MRYAITTLVTAMAASLPIAGASAATVAGQSGYAVSVWPNPFDPDLNKSITGSEATFSSGPDFSVTNSIAAVVSRVDGRGNPADGLRLQKGSDATGPATFASGRAASEFKVGTIITSQHVYKGFTTPMPYELRIGMDPSDWSSITPVTTGAGTQDTHPITTITLPAQQTVDSFRIDFTSTAVLSSTSYADFNEVLFFPQRLGYVPATLAGSSGGSGPASVLDQDGGRNGVGSFGYYDDSTGEGKFLTLSLTGGPKFVRAIVFYGWDSFPAQTFDITDGTTTLATVTSLGGEILPIRFDSIVKTSTIQINFAGTGEAGLREIVVLEWLPEPSSCMAIVLTSVACLMRRKR
jgi:hypothetical protein